jgi:hypothetical protein
MDRGMRLQEHLSRWSRTRAGVFWGKVIMIEESAVSMHMLETKLQRHVRDKAQSKQWLKKGPPCPVQAKVIVSPTKQMVFLFSTVMVLSA